MRYEYVFLVYERIQVGRLLEYQCTIVLLVTASTVLFFPVRALLSVPPFCLSFPFCLILGISKIGLGIQEKVLSYCALFLTSSSSEKLILS